MDLDKLVKEILGDSDKYSILYSHGKETETLRLQNEKLGIIDLDGIKGVEVRYHSSPVPYEITAYAQRNHEEFTYHSHCRDYMGERELAFQDFTNRVDKIMSKLPKNIMGGVLGFTYLFDNHMTIRDDLFGARMLEVQVHEAIHTNDEYETRRLHEWMLSFERPRYRR